MDKRSIELMHDEYMALMSTLGALQLLNAACVAMVMPGSHWDDWSWAAFEVRPREVAIARGLAARAPDRPREDVHDMIAGFGRDWITDARTMANVIRRMAGAHEERGLSFPVTHGLGIIEASDYARAVLAQLDEAHEAVSVHRAKGERSRSLSMVK